MMDFIISLAENSSATGAGLAMIGAGIAVFTGVAPGISQGFAAKGAVESVARNPEAIGGIRSTLIMGCAIAETTGIYGFVVALLTIFFIAMPMANAA